MDVNPLTERIAIYGPEEVSEREFIKDVVTTFINENREILSTLNNMHYLSRSIIADIYIIFNRLKYPQPDYMDILRRIHLLSKHIEKQVTDYPTLRLFPDYPKILVDLRDKIINLLNFLQEHYHNKNINIDYFIFLDLNNPLVKQFFNPIKLTPSTFKLLAVNTDSENEEILDKLQDQFYNESRMTSRLITNIDAHGANKWNRDQQRQIVPFNQMDHSKDPGYKRYSGWTKKQLTEALVETGLFDSELEKYGNLHAYKFPKLKALGLNNPVPIYSDNPEKYIKGLPRYVLEALYAKTMDTTIDWNQVCNSGADLEYLRNFVKKHLNIWIPGDREEFCFRLNSIVRNLELKEELPSIQQEFIMYPGTAEEPRIMYKKYAPTASSFGDSVAHVDIERYLTDIKNICNNPDKSSYDAYQLVVDIGLQNYVTRTDSKERICQVIENYLNVIREERIY